MYEEVSQRMAWYYAVAAPRTYFSHPKIPNKHCLPACLMNERDLFFDCRTTTNGGPCSATWKHSAVLDTRTQTHENVLEELRLGFVIEERPRDKLRNLCCKRSEQPCGQLFLVRCVSYLSIDRTVSYASVSSALAMGWTTLPLPFFAQALQHAHFDAHPMTPRTPRAPRQPRTTG